METIQEINIFGLVYAATSLTGRSDADIFASYLQAWDETHDYQKSLIRFLAGLNL